MADIVRRNDLDMRVDSAGTGDWHAGEGADRRTVRTLADYGIPCPSIARQVRSADFEEFDLILAMDENNLRDLRLWPGARPEKVRMFMSQSVPDPYYGGESGFEDMYRMIRQGCEELVAWASSPGAE